MASKKEKPKGDKPEPQEKVVCRNRKALFEYEVIDTLEAGLALTGTEVKSLRSGHASLDDAYARLEKDELWLIKCDIPEYEKGNIYNHEPKRKRKLLLHRREIDKFVKGAEQRGFTLIPLKLYFRRGYARVELALVKGKQTHDKRESMKTREAKREIERGVRRRR